MASLTKRKKQVKNLTMTHEELYKKNLGNDPRHFLYGGVYEDKRGRHIGKFSPDNIYYIQLQNATDKQDIDALYELAIKEEGRLSQLANDRDYSEAIRDEQREYDNPLQRLARDKVAGINSDLVGGSAGSAGSGSSSGAISNSVPTSQPAQGQTKFSNKYDNSSLVLNGISSVSSLFSSLTGLGSTIIGGIDTLTTLPERNKMLEVQAGIADETKSDVAQSIRLANKNSSLKNINDGLNLLGDLSGFFTPESTDDDITATLTSLGVGSKEIPNYVAGIRQYQNNPAMQARYQQNVSASNLASAYNVEYTPEVIANHIHLAREIEDNMKICDMHVSNLRSTVSSILDTQDNAQNIADGEIIANENQVDNQQLLSMRLKRDKEAFQVQLQNLVTAYQEVEKEMNIVLRRIAEDGRPSTQAERTLIQSYRSKLLAIAGLGSNYIQDGIGIMVDAAANTYMHHYNFNDAGEVESTIGIPKHEAFLNMTFHGLTTGSQSAEAMTSQIFGFVPYVGSFLSNMAQDHTPNTYNTYNTINVPYRRP